VEFIPAKGRLGKRDIGIMKKTTLIPFLQKKKEKKAHEKEGGTLYVLS